MSDSENTNVDFDAVDKLVESGKETNIEAHEEAPEAESPEDALAGFKRKYENERAARVDAERRAQAAAEHYHRASNEVDDTNLRLVESAIHTVQTDSNILKARYRDAMAAGDYDHAAEVQEAMSHNAAKLLQLHNGKQAMENRPRQAPPAPAYTDPVEAFASQLTPQSAAWVRRHPEFVTDARLNQKMIAAHNLAVADGIDPDTPDYFGYVESILQVRPSNEEAVRAPLSSASAPAQRRASPPAAPVSRTPGGTRPGTANLSAEEREMAAMMGMDEDKYAKHKSDLIKEGRIARR